MVSVIFPHNTTFNEEIFARLTRHSLAPYRLGSIKGSDIYQVTEGWQREVLLSDDNIHAVNNAEEFENAVQNPKLFSIFVLKNASLTQEITKRILERNALSKTVFWEA